MTGVYEIGHTLPCARDCSIYFNAQCVPTSALDVALEQMMVYFVENDLRDLGPTGIIKEDELAGPIERRKSSANGFNGKVRSRLFGIENTFCLQNLSPKV